MGFQINTLLTEFATPVNIVKYIAIMEVGMVWMESDEVALAGHWLAGCGSVKGKLRRLVRNYWHRASLVPRND
jgi:hypothetical protein